MKRTTTLTIDDDLLDKAKQAGINVSAVSEQALKEKLNLKDIVIPLSVKICFDCKKEYLNGLTWLWPDEKWICPSCLSRRSRFILS